MKQKKIIKRIFICSITFILIALVGILISKNEISSNTESVYTTNNNSLKNKLIKLEYERNDPNIFLVNKDTLLSDNYVADDIIESNLPFLSHIVTTKLNKTVTEHATDMFNDAKLAGINLMGASGYRTHENQVNLFNTNVKNKGKEEALKYSAPPGASEHETGFAIDIVSKDYTKLDSGFENTKAFTWLKENSHKYGFILRYPKDKVNITKYSYEPWHYRYVGTSHATKIMKNNLCLEEYLNNLDNEIKLLKNDLETTN